MKITNKNIFGIPMQECHIDMFDHYFYVFFGEKNLEKFTEAHVEEKI